MANFGDLIGGFLQNAMASSGNQRIGKSIENAERSQFNLPAGAGDLLGNLRNAVQGGLSSAASNPAAAGGLGAVLGSVLGGGSASVKGALGGGVLAMLASVAMQAYRNSQSGAQGGAETPNWSGGDVPLGLAPPETPAQEQALQQTAQLVLKGMINAAKADGQVGLEEAQNIVGRIGDSGTDVADQQWVLAEMQRPLDLEAFAAEIPNQEVAAEVYAASLLAIEVDTDAERDYLRQLAERTGLHPIVVQQIHQTMGVAV